MTDYELDQAAYKKLAEDQEDYQNRVDFEYLIWDSEEE